MSRADYFRRWRAERAKADGRAPGRPGRPPSAPCGTLAAYRRHLRRDETPCQACRDANAAAQRQRGGSLFERHPTILQAIRS